MRAIQGTIIPGNGAAAERFKTCRHVLGKYGLHFPPLRFGTINIAVQESYETPYYGIVIPYHELDDISRMNREYWQFIPVDRINDRKILGYILRTSINIHGEQVVELVAEDIGPEAEKGKEISITFTAHHE